MSYIVENPGQGNCAYYAFAIGLIDIIQKENHENQGISATFDRLKKESDLEISIEELLAINLYEQPHKKHPSILHKLQAALRELTATTYQRELLSAFEKHEPQYLLSTQAYHQFIELVKEYQKPKVQQNIKKLQHFSELALSPSVCALAQKTAKKIASKTSTHTTTSEYNAIEETLVIEIMNEDILSHCSNTPSSEIMKAFKQIEKPGRWGTHDNLRELAMALKVNLVVDGKENGKRASNLPTVTLVNQHNTHWTTKVKSRPKKSSSSYQTLTKSLKLNNAQKTHIKTLTQHVQPKYKETYSAHLSNLFKSQKAIKDAALIATTKEKAGKQLTDEELAQKLQAEEFNYLGL